MHDLDTWENLDVDFDDDYATVHEQDFSMDVFDEYSDNFYDDFDEDGVD